MVGLVGPEQFIIYWILTGIPGVIYFTKGHIKDKGYITVKHLFLFFILLLCGGMVTIGWLMIHGQEIYNNLQDKVIWRSKSNRSETVLFGNKDTDDD